MKTAQLYYTGTIVEIVDPVLYEIKVDIPDIIQGVSAFPMRGEMDEPRVGDFVLLKCLDPIFQSYYLYQKIKENDFIGFRSNGKMLDITPDYIQITTFDPELEYNDLQDSENYRPDITEWDWIRLDKDGNLNIRLRSDATAIIEGEAGATVEITSNLNITVGGDATVTVNGSTSVTTSGDTTMDTTGNTIINSVGDCSIACEGNALVDAGGNVDVVGGSNITIDSGANVDITAGANATIKGTAMTTVEAPVVTITGGMFNLKGVATPDSAGPLCAIPVCPITGIPHTGSIAVGT